MREILFRGKICRDCKGVTTQKKYKEGDWVFGDLSHTNYNPPLIDQSNDDPVPVDPDTVGQYTGSNDMNDKKIFEWDIVKITWNAVGREPVTEIHLVTYSKGCFRVSLNGRPRGMLSNYTGMTGEGYNVTVEVIGNIWDNAELLKGDTDHAE